MSLAALVHHRRTRLVAGLLGSAIVALIAMPAIALAVPMPPTAPPDADANCDTLPLTYPGNGVPVPVEASCRVVTAPAGIPVAEVWAWGDGGGLHWYNYAAEGYLSGSGPLLTMCATEDESAEGVEYECSTDSYYLLFTMENLFVTWPSIVVDDLYYCEAVDLVGPDGVPVRAHTCGTLSVIADGDIAPPSTTAPPTTPPPTAPEPSPPVEPPATEATQPVDEPAGPDDPAAQPTQSSGAPVPPATSSPETSASAPDDDDPRGLPEGPSSAAVATPVDSQSVATVGGAAFPVALVFGLAGALALGGVGVLVAPGAFAALRRRT